MCTFKKLCLKSGMSLGTLLVKSIKVQYSFKFRGRYTQSKTVTMTNRKRLGVFTQRKHVTNAHRVFIVVIVLLTKRSKNNQHYCFIIHLEPGSHGVVNWVRILLLGGLVVITTWCELLIVIVGLLNDQRQK
jgi:hypothetical protein